MVHKADKINDGNPNCDWQWITLMGTYQTSDDAKQHLNPHADKLATILKIKTEQ